MYSSQRINFELSKKLHALSIPPIGHKYFFENGEVFTAGEIFTASTHGYTTPCAYQGIDLLALLPPRFSLDGKEYCLMIEPMECGNISINYRAVDHEVDSNDGWKIKTYVLEIKPSSGRKSLQCISSNFPDALGEMIIKLIELKIISPSSCHPTPNTN